MIAVCSLAQPCLTLHRPEDCSLPGSSVSGDSLGKNTGVGCHAFLRVIFLTQESNSSLLCLLHWQVDYYKWTLFFSHFFAFSYT